MRVRWERVLEISGNSSRDQVRGAKDQRISFSGKRGYLDGGMEVAGLRELFPSACGIPGVDEWKVSIATEPVWLRYRFLKR